MSICVAIPQPSSDLEYSRRSLPPYLSAMKSIEADPVVIRLDEKQQDVAAKLANTTALLLPGSRFDVDPERYGQARSPECGPSDRDRTAVDELLLQDAFNLRKPILAICHGVQTLNVWLNGTLIQDLGVALHTQVNHAPGRDVIDAHRIEILSGTRLAAIADSASDGGRAWQCNSSHHQAIATIGDNLRVSALSPADEVIEAVELNSEKHFVLGVQWHPERTLEVSPLSRAIFEAFADAAASWQVSALERRRVGV